MTTQRSVARRWIGEFFVIVTGVMIALAADRWMQGVDEREVEGEYLQLLREDFEATAASLARGADGAEVFASRARLVSALLAGAVPDSIGALEIAMALGSAHNLANPEIPRDAWRDLVGTGRLQLLENAELRRALSAFYQRYDLIAGFQPGWREFNLVYRRALGEVLSPELRFAVTQSWLGGVPVPGELIPERAELVRAARASGPLQSGLGDVLSTSWASAATYRRLAQDAAAILTMLESELAGA